MTDAKTINTEAAAWIERRDRADWREADQAQFDLWLSQSTAHLIAYYRMQDAWGRSEKLIVLREQSEQRLSPDRSTMSLKFKAAAVAVALAALGAGVLLLDRPNDRVYVTAVGEHQVLKLSNGSKIELNTDTVVRVAQSGREVVLDRGEAFFQVQHDAAHPFVVAVGNSRVTDLGTKFNIRKDANRLEVSLVEGRARVDLADAASRPTILTPGDVLIETGEAVSTRKHSVADVSDALGWRRDVIVFSHTALADAVAEINRYNRKQIVVVDSAAAKVKIGGTFPVNGTAQLAEVARDLFRLRVEDRGDEVVISR